MAPEKMPRCRNSEKNNMRGGKAKLQMHQPAKPQTARQNRLLDALPAAVYQRLLPYLELVALPLAPTRVPLPGSSRYAYFPTTSVVSLSYALEDGVAAKAWQVGNEGVIGLSSLSGPIQAHQAEVQTAGYAFRLATHALKTEFERGGAFQQLLLRYLQALITQVSQLGICNQYHLLDQRLCRLLLRAFDQAPADQLAITHQQTADLLGVRRVGITEAVGKLHAAGIVRCGRGRLTLLSRRKLEAQACACYAVIKKEFDGLLPGKKASR